MFGEYIEGNLNQCLQCIQDVITGFHRPSPPVGEVWTEKFSLLSKYIFYIYIVLYLTFVGGKSLKSDGWLWYKNKKRYHIRSSKDRYIY